MSPSTAITAADTMASGIKSVDTATLSIAYEEHGAGEPVILLHGWPYDPRCYDDVAPLIAAAGGRVIVPYLRGFGPTRFRFPDAPRSGQQAALGHDLLALMDGLGLERALLAGYDWGGRAACIVAALWPQRVRGLVSVNAYNIQNIAAAMTPATPEQERRLWYQYYFHNERGRAGLEADRRALCRLLWQLWSPDWRFDDETFARSAASFDNTDFVAVTIHSYRHRFGLVGGDPALADIERKLAAQPSIGVPTIALQGESDGVWPPATTKRHRRHFSGPYELRLLPGIGHNPPQEVPRQFAEAVLELL
jgi:pimeloyl-ACP methyl ester carboxylesterase